MKVETERAYDNIPLTHKICVKLQTIDPAIPEK